MPVTLPRSAFLLNAPGAGSRELFLGQTLLIASLARPYGEGFNAPAPGYRIHRAHHASNSGTRALLELKHGSHLVVAVREGEVVGFARRDLLWVHPDHRGQRLGPEITAELYVFMGCEQWSHEQWAAQLGSPQLTLRGHHNRSGTYDVLVRRGIIAPDNT
jgi:GNAT superfamily N-acetyltransferase